MNLQSTVSDNRKLSDRKVACFEVCMLMGCFLWSISGYFRAQVSKVLESPGQAWGSVALHTPNACSAGLGPWPVRREDRGHWTRMKLRSSKVKQSNNWKWQSSRIIGGFLRLGSTAPKRFANYCQVLPAKTQQVLSPVADRSAATGWAQRESKQMPHPSAGKPTALAGENPLAKGAHWPNSTY